VTISVSTATKLKEALLKDARKDVVKRANKIYRGVVDRSPIREGSFRANWRITQHRKSRAKFKRVGSVEFPAAAPKPRKLKFGRGVLPVIYITNNAPYGELLEAGSSSQAPNGIIAAVMAGIDE
jgi:hypothetical protein